MGILTAVVKDWRIYCNVLGVFSRAARQPCVTGDWLCQWEMAIFDPPQNKHPLTDHQKIWYWWLRRRPLRLRQIWCISVDGGFWANGWNITNFFLFIPFFYQLTYRSDATTDFHAWWLKRRGLAQGCAFWGFVDIAPHVGGEIPPKPQFWGRE